MHLTNLCSPNPAESPNQSFKDLQSLDPNHRDDLCLLGSKRRHLQAGMVQRNLRRGSCASTWVNIKEGKTHQTTDGRAAFQVEPSETPLRALWPQRQLCFLGFRRQHTEEASGQLLHRHTHLKARKSSCGRDTSKLAKLTGAWGLALGSHAEGAERSVQEGLLGLGKVFWSPALERLSGCQALSLSLSQPGTRVKLIGTEVRPEEELVQPDPEQYLSSFRALWVPFLEVSLIRISSALEFTLGFPDFEKLQLKP